MSKQAISICTRFAPSPSGYLHLGNIRTALFNALLAYGNGGRFIVRIEDTDPSRSSNSAIQAIQEDLKWLGLYDMTEGKTRLYIQSHRYSIYQQYYHELLSKGVVYPCFCRNERLEALREKQRIDRLPPGYDGQCRQLSLEEVMYRQAQGEKPSLRFKIPKGQTIVLTDLVKGVQRIKSDALKDFIIQRSDGHPAFLYCNVLDDALMGITHVLRGEDHLTNTVKQRLLLTALDLPVPHYGHLPLICHQTTTLPLSKRDNSFSLRSLKVQGYLRQAVLNYLARLGHTIPSNALLSLDELSQLFSIKNLHANAAHFDKAQLDFWQKQAMRMQSVDAFWQLLSFDSKAKVPCQKRDLFVDVVRPMILLPAEAQEWIDRLFTVYLDYSPDSIAAIQLADPTIWSQLVHILTQHVGDDLSLLASMKGCIKTVSKAQQSVHWKALRAALTDCCFGPDLLSLLGLIGIQNTLQRLQKAADLVSKRTC